MTWCDKIAWHDKYGLTKVKVVLRTGLELCDSKSSCSILYILMTSAKTKQSVPHCSHTISFKSKSDNTKISKKQYMYIIKSYRQITTTDKITDILGLPSKWVLQSNFLHMCQISGCESWDIERVICTQP